MGLAACGPAMRSAVTIHYDGPEGEADYIVSRLRAALGGIDAPSALDTIQLLIDPAMVAESYVVERGRVHPRIVIRAADRRGLIYGGFNLLEQLRHGRTLDSIENQTAEPRVKFRAIKFNLPWDSYRSGLTLEQHIETCRDLGFWERLLDMLAENRINTLSLWNLHPFDYMVEAEGFPEAHTFTGEEMEAWRRLFRGIFSMAKERGIETYIVTWNIFLPRGFAEEHGVNLDNLDHHHIGKGETSPIIEAYTRTVVRQVIDEYPDLTGIGFSLGERMGGMSVAEREEWFMNTYIEGIKAASRPVKLIHRAPFSANTASGGSMDHETEVLTRNAIESIDGVETPIWVEVKFNWSHAHSTPRLVKTHGGPINDVYWNPLPTNYRIAWQMRNEDFFCLRWGQADFIREHIALNNHAASGGYFIGSECYIPAWDYFTKLPGADWDYAFERQWLFYKLWGRLLYDPGTPDKVFENEFVARYGPEARPLFAAYAKASTMPLRLLSAFDIGWDYTMHAETFSALAQKGQKRPFIDIETLIQQAPLDPAHLSVADFVAGRGEGSITPLEQADAIEHDMRMALAEIAGIEADSTALRYEVGDVRAWAYLGLYYADKLRAAVALERFRVEGRQDEKTRALAAIDQAIHWWAELIDLTTTLYKPFPTMVYMNQPEPLFHWSNLRDAVTEDRAVIEAANGSP